MKKRVVVTGLGVVSAIGSGREAFWKNLVEGRSGISEVSLFDTSRFHCHNAGEIKDFHPADFIPKRMLDFFGRASQFAIAAAAMAAEDASLPMSDLRKQKTALIMGVTIPEGNAVDSSSELFISKKLKKVEPRALLNIFSPSISRDMGYFFKLQNTNVLIPNACAAGNFSIGYGSDLIRSGSADVALVGGAEALSRVAFQGFQTMRAMSPDVCSPFDLNRKGMLLGEGAGVLLLESYESAIKRGAHIYAEVLGFGISCDAHHITIPKREGIKKCMVKALKDARIAESDVDYICAHGTGTPANDKEESGAIREIFGSRTKDIPVSSIKSMLGHSLGAASAIESVACCLALKEGMVPPTINYKTPDPACDVDCVPNKARKKKLNIVLNNGFAFGGNNCCVVFKGLTS